MPEMNFVSAAAGAFAGATIASYFWLKRLRDTRADLQAGFAELKDRYDLLTQNLAASVIIRNAAGKITYCSPFTEVLTGYALNEIYSHPNDFLISITHPEDREKFEKAGKISLAGEAFQFRYRLFHKTGIELWLETRTVPIYDQDGNFVSSLSITLDVTGTVRYQRQVEEKNRDLHDFSYMVSHDLKAPIFTIKGMVNILEEDLNDKKDPEVKDTINHITKATRRLEDLVTGVLEYSRVSAQDGNIEDVDLGSVLQDIKDEVFQDLKAINGSLFIDGPFPPIKGDRNRTYQVFRNLVSNAIKYREHARPLVVRIAAAPQTQDALLRISVEDNGLGIPADKVHDIFRPFHRAHGNQIEGSGIGLACVKKILEKAGASIEIASHVGQGSRFTILWPD